MKEAFPQVTTVYERNRDAKKLIVVNVGGANSSKSYSLAQLLIEKFFGEKDKAFLIVRKTMPSNRLTSYRLIINLLKEYDRYRFVRHNKAFHTIEYDGNFMQFSGLDDPEKIKSAEFNYEWLEESNEFSYEDFTILKMRLRRKTTDDNPNHMYLSCNPTDEYGWIRTKIRPEECERIHSTYKDNPFAQNVDIEVLESFKEQDDSYYKIYALGEYALIKGKIHKPLRMLSEFPEPKETIYGLDFGFTNPSAFLQIDINMEEMALFFTERLWERRLTNEDLIEKLKTMDINKDTEIYADSAEPNRIEEIYRAGFNCQPSEKAVIFGIDLLNRFTPYSLESNINFNREWERYKRKVDKNDIVLEEPLKLNDHFPNAARYAIYTHLRERILKYQKAVVYETMAQPTAAKSNDRELWLAANEAIQKHGKVQLSIFARSWGHADEPMRQKLLALGLIEHEQNRFVHGEEFFKNRPKDDDKKSKETKDREAKFYVT